MLSAIKFHDQFLFRAQKIDCIYADRLLATKFQAEQAVGTQTRPQQVLSVGLLGAEVAGEIELLHV